MKYYTLTLIAFLLLNISCKKDTQPAPIPEYYNDGLADGINYGIAAQYNNDEGIENNEFVLAVENFESGTVTIPTEENRYEQNVVVTNTEGFNSTYAAQHSWDEGSNGPTCRYPLPTEAHSDERPAYFVRMYFKFDSSFHPYHGADLPEGDFAPVGVKGFGIYNESGPSGVNEPCDGTNWYCVSCQFVGWGPSVKEVANNKFLWFGHMYSYNPSPEKAIAESGTIKITNPAKGDSPYRFSIYSDPYQYIKFGEWNCYEIGLYMNIPGMHNGEARFWINGVLQSRATNMKFCDIQDMNPLTVHLNLHRTTDNFPHVMKRYADNIVIARRYIGPVKQE